MFVLVVVLVLVLRSFSNPEDEGEDEGVRFFESFGVSKNRVDPPNAGC